MPVGNVEIFGFTGLNSIFKLGDTDNDGILKFNSRITEGINLLSSGYEPVSRHLGTDEIKYILAITKNDVSYIPVGYSLYPDNVPLHTKKIFLKKQNYLQIAVSIDLVTRLILRAWLENTPKEKSVLPVDS